VNNRRHLSKTLFAAVMVAFLLATAEWVAALLFAFRRPSGNSRRTAIPRKAYFRKTAVRVSRRRGLGASSPKGQFCFASGRQLLKPSLSMAGTAAHSRKVIAIRSETTPPFITNRTRPGIGGGGSQIPRLAGDRERHVSTRPRHPASSDSCRGVSRASKRLANP